ncbi:hypothetical protein K5X82_13580 [Halosquirtibacter xylanolyticus]|uniref:S41 family peptidase n=1 Tax=Halosquirtibacter xylanolyticus TaxID=3374599 RepID=UPI0037481940|nr:hypothetical protein K5X82_13580 [Prolixibacteraceae bacterium]
MRKFIIAFIVLLTGVQAFASGQEKDKRTPFSKIEFREGLPYTMYNKEWVKLVSIEGVSIDVYLDRAKEKEPRIWKYVFTRYLHYLMDDMNMKRGKTVSVEFYLNDKVVTKDFELKKENRDLASLYLEEELSKSRIERNHTHAIPDELKYIVKRIDGYEPVKSDWLTKQEVIEDLEHLEWEIVNHYSYADRVGFDYKSGIDVIIQDLRKGITKRDFALQLKILMANFGDGHSRVSMGRYVLTREDRKMRLPLQIIQHDGVFYGKDLKSDNFYNESYPQIIALNNIPVSELFLLAKQMVPKTTSKFVDRGAEQYLSYTKFMLQLAGADVAQSVDVTLGNGHERVIKKVKLSDYKGTISRHRFYFKEKRLEGNIGYLAMNIYMDRKDRFIDSLHVSMQRLKDTDGLIIDIRGNGGGSRAPLLALLPYLIQEPTVTNVARYRINEEEDIHPKNGYFDARYAYPIDSDKLSSDEKRAIKRFNRTFKPSSVVSNKKFTDYHYMVISPAAKQDNAFYYKNKVIVLIDEACFSASDIFAAGIKQGDNVSLLGNTTGGGSGFSMSRPLSNSGIKVKMSTMYSYQPNGQLYDGHGVVPDIKNDYTLKDRLGITDSQLEKALQQLR